MPGKEERNWGGASSWRWIGTTPHAPWTMNWIRKAPAVRVPQFDGRTHMGIRAAPQIVATMMVARRPKNWE